MADAGDANAAERQIKGWTVGKKEVPIAAEGWARISALAKSRSFNL
jgi:hypothetical protein